MLHLIFNTQKIATVTLGLGLSVAAHAAAIADYPITAFEPGLEINDRIGGEMGWINNNVLLVTTQINAKSQFWERKLMAVDITTKTTKELINPGNLLCINPDENVIQAMVGSPAKMFSGDSKVPEPELKAFGWASWANKLTPKTWSDDWNPYICKKTAQNHAQIPASMLLYAEHGISYLNAKDDYLEFAANRRGGGGNVVLVKNKKPIATVPVAPSEIGMQVLYLAFRDEYLLSMGKFLPGGLVIRTPDKAPTSELPLITMTQAGGVTRQYFSALFKNSGLDISGQTLPYAKGNLIFATHRPQDGGGIYRNQGALTQRIWCTKDGNSYRRECRILSFSISPDGCHLAFFEAGSDNPKSPDSYQPSLKILPLCN